MPLSDTGDQTEHLKKKVFTPIYKRIKLSYGLSIPNCNDKKDKKYQGKFEVHKVVSMGPPLRIKDPLGAFPILDLFAPDRFDTLYQSERVI